MIKFRNKLNVIIKSCLLICVMLFVVATTNSNEVKTSSSNFNFTLDLNSMAKKVKEDIENDIYSAKDTFTGYLTGYGADCPLCSGKLACMPSLDVLHGDVMFTDAIYGRVNIVASSSNLNCGSIIRINEHKLGVEPIYAVVLDRGVGGNNLDLLSVNEAYAYDNVGRSVISYDVLRKGW